MKFNTIEEMITEMQRITEGNIADFDIDIRVQKIVNESFGPKPKEVSEKQVQVASLGGDPTVTVQIDESLDENILFVKSYESIPLSCGTGKISFLGREIFANICEANEGAPTVNLNIREGDEVVSKTFRLKLNESASDSKYVMILNSKN